LYNYKKLFERVSTTLTINDKHFNTLFINNTAITEIEDDLFKDLTFNLIQLRDTTNLRKIHPHAFTASAATVLEFRQEGASLLGEDDADIPDLFTALSSFSNIKQIILQATKLRSIPQTAFSNPNQNKLTHLEFSSGQIAQVGTHAFYYLTSLENLYLRKQQLSKISLHSFDFQKSNSIGLSVYLEGNGLEDAGVEVNSFTDTKRPISLYLGSNHLTHLTKDIFRPILAANNRTTIDVENNPFRCNCEVSWLVRGKTMYSTRITNAVCKGEPHDMTKLWDLKAIDFIDCPDDA